MHRIVLVVAFLLGGCAESQLAGRPLKLIETSVPLSQIDSVARDVQQWHNTQYPKCKFDSVVGTKIAKQEINTASEQWTIKACNEKVFTYAVFVERHSGGISDSVSNVDGRPLHLDSPEIK
jgi:hypothetical protein